MFPPKLFEAFIVQIAHTTMALEVGALVFAKYNEQPAWPAEVVESLGDGVWKLEFFGRKNTTKGRYGEVSFPKRLHILKDAIHQVTTDKVEDFTAAFNRRSKGSKEFQGALDPAVMLSYAPACVFTC